MAIPRTRALMLGAGMLSVWGVAGAGVAFGQAIEATAVPSETPTAGQADQPQADAGLAEIVVTAQRRSESLQKVPTTITALSSDALETRQISDVLSLQTEVPSLVVGGFFGASNISLRGISTGITSGAEDPSVATHINGVYQPRSRSVDSALADLDRVEVLSGPQGTLYGRNATGGVINYILKRPTDTLSGEVSGSAGNYERYGIRARVSGPLSDDVRVLVSGIYEDQDRGFAKNLLAGAPRRTLDRSSNRGARLAVDVGDNAGVNAQVEAIYLDTRYVPLTEAFTRPPLPALRDFLVAQSTTPRRTYTQRAVFGRSRYFQAMATVNVPLGDTVDLKSITGYQRFRDRMLLDGDTSPVSSVETAQRIRSKTFTQEFDLNASLIDGRLKSLVGLFFFDDDFFSASATPFSIPGFAANFTTTTKIKSRSYSAFTDHTFSVTDRFRLQGGLRFNRDEKTGDPRLLIEGVPACVVGPQERNSSSWTPRIGAQYDVAPRAMLYGQWSKGFKSGGFTANSCGNGFNPEKIEGPEVGIKTTLLNNRVRFNLAGYYYDYSDLQVQKQVGVGTFSVVNAASSRIYGAEFSLSALLTPAFSIDASGMAQSAKYTNFTNCNEAAFVGACSAADPNQTQTDVSGNWLNRAPSHTLNLGAQYDLRLGGGGHVVLRAETYFSGPIHYSEFDIAGSVQGAYSLQNAYVTYTTADDRYVIRGYVKNIGDVDWKRSYFFGSTLFFGGGNYGPPRTYGIEGVVRF